MVNRWSKLLALALGGVMFAITAGCGGDDDNPPPMPAPSTTQIRALNASPNLSPVDVFLDGATISTGTATGQQTGFADVLPGVHRIQVANAGTGATNSRIDVSPPLNANVRYTAVVLGDATQTSGAERLQSVLIEDGGAQPGSGDIKLRVVHGAPGVGSVDVFISQPNSPLPALPIFGNLDFSAVAPASSTPAFTMGSGDYRIRIRPAGQSTVIYDSGMVRFDGNSDLIAVVVRDLGPGPSTSPVQVLVFASSGSASFWRDNLASVRFAHLSPNLPPVDFFLKAQNATNDASNRIASGLSYPDASAYLPFTQGTYDVSAALVNTLAGVVNLDDMQIVRGTSTSVFAIGVLNSTGGQAPQLKAFVDDRTPLAGQAKVRVIHLAPDAPNVDVVTLTSGGAIDQRIVTNLAYANSTSTSLTLAPGTYTLAVVSTGASTPLLPTPSGVSVTLAAGDLKTVVAAGALSPGATNPAAQPFELRVLDDK